MMKKTIHGGVNHVITKSRGTAFTLIELLVVISIIALLVSILLPSLNAAKDIAKRVLCLSNTRTLMSSQLLYVQDNDGSFTPCYDLSISMAYMGELIHYEYLSDWLLCPKQEEIYRNTWGEYCIQYAVNTNICGLIFADGTIPSGYPIYRIGNLEKPASTIIHGEVDKDRTNGSLSWGYRYNGLEAFRNRYSERHEGGSNFAFGDGHVEYAPDPLNFDEPEYFYYSSSLY